MSVRKLLIIFTVMGIAGTVIFGYFFYTQQKDVALNTLQTYLEDEGIADKVQSQDVSFTLKSSTYVVEIVFEDEPEIIYEFYPLSETIDEIKAYDQKRIQIKDKNEASYLRDEDLME